MSVRTLSLLEVVGEGWNKLSCPISELRLDIVLNCGQSFRWRLIAPSVWASVLDSRVWILSQNNSEILYKVFSSSSSSSSSVTPSPAASSSIEEDSTAKKTLEYEAQLRDYFQLDLCRLSDLYPRWRRVDPHFDACCDQFQGVRTLRQHPVENLFAFICSSNNNIARISSMVENLCVHFGEDCGIIIEGEKQERFYTFPRIERLTVFGVEEKLRTLGFGYRAKFVAASAQSILDNGGEEWLFSLRQKPYHEAKAGLLKLCGVGAKVADCVCLMSLDKNGVVPVDTHVLQIAQRYLKTGINCDEAPGDSDACLTDQCTKGKCKSKAKDLKDGNKPEEAPADLASVMASTKTLTPRLYEAIGDYFRSIWGVEFAGWAQSVVFAADLKSFPKNGKTKNQYWKAGRLEVLEGVKSKKKKRSC